MFRVITPDYADHWKTIGDLLGVPTTLLDGTETTNPTNQQWCCSEMLKIWLASNTSATWKDILEAIDTATITKGVSSSVDIKQSGPLNGVWMFLCILYNVQLVIKVPYIVQRHLMCITNLNVINKYQNSHS